MLYLIFRQNRGGNINTILQLRLHPSIIELKNKIDSDTNNKKYDVDFTYITSRGNWYYTSWKGNESKSGGITTNIGVHFFDMLGWIFGEVQESQVHLRENSKSAGYLEFEKARVRWFLSIGETDLPEGIKEKGQRTFRSITIDNEELEFSGGFEDLHTKSYQEILAGNGFGLEDVRQSIAIAHFIRNSKLSLNREMKHEF